MKKEESGAEFQVDITNCDREPIHIPGNIQPFGFLLCVDAFTFTIQIASENVKQHVGKTAQQLFGRTLEELLSAAELKKITSAPHNSDDEKKIIDVAFDLPNHTFSAKAGIHLHDQLLWLEFEPIADKHLARLDISQLNHAFKYFSNTKSVKEFCQVMASQIREITGFDRVMLYRFKPDESGEVIAEAKTDGIESFLGLHYPASDIPQQARAMYKKSLLRFIPDVNFIPVAIYPNENPLTGNPVDMTYAVLRSVSPIHLQYLKNMGVTASMSVSLMKEDKLWGLIACHHYSPHLIDYDRRELCKLLGNTFSSLIGDKEEKEDREYRLQIMNTQASLFESITGKEDFGAALKQSATRIKEIFDCGGAALQLENELTLVGTTPTMDEIRKLTGWLQRQVHQDVFMTEQLSDHYPEAESFKKTGSGLLAISISKVQGDYILWFRPEVVQTVTWAGNPEKAVAVSKEGELELSPRQSFAAWTQMVEGTSNSWKSFEIQAAREIRTLLIDILLQVAGELKLRADILSRLNSELEESNTELDSFAYIASHDLKEPLRGIHNYATFLLEDYEDKLDEDGIKKLQTLVRLSERLRNLIDSLFEFSRLGRLSFSLSEINLQNLVEETIDTIYPQLEKNGTTVEIVNRLPTIVCDNVRVPQVFHNLITNAMKYNKNEKKKIEIGSLIANKKNFSSQNIQVGNHVFFVKDNGIGIDPKFYDTIFVMFKRLHTHNKFGEGTGVGLPIVKKIIEKHGGKIWIESEPDLGTTFYFTLLK